MTLLSSGTVYTAYGEQSLAAFADYTSISLQYIQYIQYINSI